MGKPKSHSAKAKKLAKKKGLLATKDPTYSIDEILNKAEEFMNEYQYETAQKFCQRALEMDCDNVRGLELSGALLLEMGDLDSARHCYGRAVTVQPDAGHSKYMILAQLFTGAEARDIYVKGIEVLAAAAAGGELRRELSTAWVAVAELYMTDLCDEEQAEEEAKRCIEEAVAADESNPEAHQAMASYLLVKEEVEGAREAIDKSVSLWLPAHVAMLERGGEEECQLDYNTRLVTAKILIEVGDWDNGTAVLDGLVAEDDEVVAAWYLLGWLNYHRGEEEYTGNARFYLNKAKQVHVVKPTDDDEMMEHVEEILAELGKCEVVEEDVVSGGLANIGDNDGEMSADRIADILDQEAGEEGEEEDDKMED